MPKVKKCKGCGRKIIFGDNRDYCGQCQKIPEKLDEEKIRGDILKVLIIIDYYGWAFDFVTRGIQKYSKHDITIKRWNELNISDVRHDVVFFMNSSCYRALKGLKGQRQIFHMFERSNIKKCVGVRAVEYTSCDQPIIGWNIGCVSQQIYDELKSKGIPKLFLTRNGVDMDIFKPIDRPENRFVVGWAGNPNRLEKRYRLLRQINFPLAVQIKHGQNFFIQNRSRDEMLEFYKKIDCFVNISSHEGMPQSILEAAATKLPIVATMAGGIPELVDPEWLVDTKLPDKKAMEEFNYKLGRLASNPQLRRAYGEANYQKVLSSWNWKYIVEDYDKMFEG